MKIRSAAKTHVGLVRTNNEDSYLCDDTLALYAVADGMGGHAAGEVASRLAIETLMRNALMLKHGSNLRGLNEQIFIKADAAIARDVAEHPERAGMGTTLTMLAVRKSIAVVAHVGDSRCYLVRDGVGRQLTQDHAVPETSILLNCLGSRPGSHVRTDIVTEEARPGDVFILCSDGLSNSIPADDFARAAKLYRHNLPELCECITHLALKRDGADNITVVVVAVEAD